MDEDQRTTPLGLMNYAHSYWVAAVVLQVTHREVTHKDAPMDYLYYQAIELYLKSFLRLKGYSLKQIRALGHDFSKLHGRAIAEGLTCDPDDAEVIATIQKNYLPSRYIQTGFFSKPHPEQLWSICRMLHWDIEPMINESVGIGRKRAIPYLDEPD